MYESANYRKSRPVWTRVFAPAGKILTYSNSYLFFSRNAGSSAPCFFTGSFFLKYFSQIPLFQKINANFAKEAFAYGRRRGCPESPRKLWEGFGGVPKVSRKLRQGFGSVPKVPRNLRRGFEGVPKVPRKLRRGFGGVPKVPRNLRQGFGGVMKT